MCITTPRVVQGVHYDGPTSCEDFVSTRMKAFIDPCSPSPRAKGHGEFGTSPMKVVPELLQVSSRSLRRSVLLFLYLDAIFFCNGVIVQRSKTLFIVVRGVSPESNRNPLAEGYTRSCCITSSRYASRYTTRSVPRADEGWLRSSYGFGPKISGLR